MALRDFGYRCRHDQRQAVPPAPWQPSAHRASRAGLAGATPPLWDPAYPGVMIGWSKRGFADENRDASYHPAGHDRVYHGPARESAGAVHLGPAPERGLRARQGW